MAWSLLWLGGLFHLAFFIGLIAFLSWIVFMIFKALFGKTTKGLPKGFKNIFK